MEYLYPFFVRELKYSRFLCISDPYLNIKVTLHKYGNVLMYSNQTCSKVHNLQVVINYKCVALTCHFIL